MFQREVVGVLQQKTASLYIGIDSFMDIRLG